MSLSCTVFEILSLIITYFPKFKEITWPWTHPFGGNLSFLH